MNKHLLVAFLCGLSVLLGSALFAQADTPAASPAPAATPAATPAPAAPAAQTAPAAAATALTKADVEAFLKQMDAAVTAKNTEAVAALIADDVKIVARNMPSENGTQTIELKKADYLGNLKASWEAMKTYSYERKDVVIDLNKEGTKATIKDTLVESATTADRKIDSVTKEIGEVELRGGKVVLTLLDGEVVELKGL